MSALATRLAAASTVVILILGLIVWGRAQSNRADRWQAHAKIEANNHKQTKANYRAAQAEADRLEAERLAKAKAKQQEITNDVREDYAANLAALRARYQRLLDAARARADGAAHGVAVPAASQAPGRADAPPGLRLACPLGGLRFEERLTAAEQAEQLNALIDWVERQSKEN